MNELSRDHLKTTMELLDITTGTPLMRRQSGLFLSRVMGSQSSVAAMGHRPKLLARVPREVPKATKKGKSIAPTSRCHYWR
jgi:hypothetical protein